MGIFIARLGLSERQRKAEEQGREKGLVRVAEERSEASVEIGGNWRESKRRADRSEGSKGSEE